MTGWPARRMADQATSVNVMSQCSPTGWRTGRSSWRRRCVPTRHVFEYAVLRFVPRVDREEFLNVGVVLFAPTAPFLGARAHLDAARARALDASSDLAAVQAQLEAV